MVVMAGGREQKCLRGRRGGTPGGSLGRTFSCAVAEGAESQRPLLAPSR
jgi:hypothetical protein